MYFVSKPLYKNEWERIKKSDNNILLCGTYSTYQAGSRCGEILVSSELIELSLV